MDWWKLQLTCIISNSKGPECMVWGNSSLSKKELKFKEHIDIKTDIILY